jgi:hypothetical protein
LAGDAVERRERCAEASALERRCAGRGEEPRERGRLRFRIGKPQQIGQGESEAQGGQ